VNLTITSNSFFQFIDVFCLNFAVVVFNSGLSVPLRECPHDVERNTIASSITVSVGSN